MIKHLNTNLIKILALVSLALMIIFSKYVFGPFLYLFDDIGSDTMTQFFPRMLERAHEGNGWLDTYSFHRGLGQNIFSKDLFNPFKWPQYFLGYSAMAHHIIYIQIIKIIFTSYFMYKALNMIGLHKNIVLLGSICFALSGYSIISSGWYGHSDYLLFIAAGIYALELLIQRKMYWPLALVLYFMFGSRIIFFLEFILLYLFLRWPDMDFESTGQSKKNLAILLLKSGALAVLLLAPFFVSSLFTIMNSPRVGGEEALFESLMTKPIFEFVDFDQLVTLFMRSLNPNALGTGDGYQGWNNYLEAPNFYIGLIHLLLIPQAFFLFGKKHKIVFGTVLGFWCLLLLFPYLRYAFYFFVGNYYKSAVSIYLPFCFMYVSLRSLDKIIKGAKLRVIPLLATATIYLILLNYWADYSPAKESIQYCNIILPLLTIGLLAFRLSQKSIFMTIIILMTVVELTSFGFMSQTERKAIKKRDFRERTYFNDYTSEAVAYTKAKTQPFFRIEKTYGSYKGGFNDASAQNYFSTKSYDSHNNNYLISFYRNYGLLRDMEENTKWVMGSVSDFYVQPFLNTKYMFSKPETDVYVWKTMYEKVHEENGISIYENILYLPFGIPIDRVISPENFKKIESKDAKQKSLYRVVVVDSPYLNKDIPIQTSDSYYDSGAFVSTDVTRLRAKSMTMKSFSQSKIIGNIHLNENSVLSFSMPFDLGWKATVNGKPAQLIPINFGLTGLILSNGTFEIVLTYRPPYFYVGCVLFVLGLGWLVFLYYQKRKQLISENPLNE